MRIGKIYFTILAVSLLSGILIFNDSNSLSSNNFEISSYPDGTNNEVSKFDSFINELSKQNLNNFLDKSGMNFNDQLSMRANHNNLGIELNAYTDQVVIAFDVTHTPLVTSVSGLADDVLSYGAEFMMIDGEFIIPNEVNVLLLSASANLYSQEDMDQIFNWFYSDGPHLLWIGGDSDFGAMYNPDQDNLILESINSNLRFSADGVFDDYYNDGQPYRVAITNPACDGELSCTFTEGVGSAIFHGPTSVLGYSDGGVLDLNSNYIDGVEVIMRSSSDAYSIDQDASVNEFDYYSTNGIVGDYPMMAIQDMGDARFVITSGDSIFSDYMHMYSFETESGANGLPNAWNGGFHEGKQLVDNVLTWWGVQRETYDEPIFINNNYDFEGYGFPGSGTEDDPYIIEGLSLTNPYSDLISVTFTDAHFIVRNNIFNGIWRGNIGIYLLGVRNAIIEDNYFSGSWTAIHLDRSVGNIIRNNVMESNFEGIALYASRHNDISGNTISNSEWSGINIFNDAPWVFMRFFEDITATVRDSIIWQASIVDPDEGVVWYYRDNLEVVLTVDGNPLDVNFWDVYFDEESGLWKFDMEAFSDPLSVGEHEFESHFILEGEEILVAFGHVTVVENEIVPIRFWEDAAITEGDQIAWQASYVDPSFELLDEILPLDGTTLTVNGEFVELIYSEVYFDDEIELFRFDIDYATGPLTIGEYVFDVVFITDGVETYADTAYVDVLPFDYDDNNNLNGNYIGFGGQGIYLDRSNGNIIDSNTMEFNWDSGLTMWDSDRNSISHNTAKNNGWNGFTISGSDNTLMDNVALWNGNGLGLYESSNTDVRENQFLQNWGTGVEIYSSAQSTLNDNVVSGNNWVGFYIENAMTLDLNGNNVENNGGEGMLIINSHELIISENSFRYDAVGISLIGSTSNQILSNEISECYGGGLGILYQSDNNIVRSNSIHDMYWEDGIGLWNSNYNEITENEIFNTDDAIIFRFSSNNLIEDNHLHDNNQGIYLTAQPFNPVSIRFYEDVTVSDLESILWQASSLSDDYDYLQYEHDNIIVDLQVDGEPVWVYISEIWFDWETELYRYDMDYYSEPLSIGEHYFTVRFILEGEFELEFTATVTVIPNESSSSSNSIVHNTIERSFSNAIAMFESDGNLISHNTIDVSYWAGVELVQSQNNEISLNEISNSGLSGVFGQTSGGNEISHNHITQSGYAGVTLYDISVGNSIKHNELVNSQYGVSLESSSENQVSWNKFEGNFYGMYVYDSGQNDISHNKYSENYAGVVFYFSNENTISYNQFESNSYGVALIYSNNNLVSSNHFNSNYIAVYFIYAEGNILSENIFKRNHSDVIIID